MITIVRERKQVNEKHWVHEFWWETPLGGGYSFDVAPNGELLAVAPKEARANYEYALTLPFVNGRQLYDAGVKEHKNTYVEPAVGRCRCGELVTLAPYYMGATSCPKCGQWYNVTGQELIPPQYWEDDCK